MAHQWKHTASDVRRSTAATPAQPQTDGVSGETARAACRTLAGILAFSPDMWRVVRQSEDGYTVGPTRPHIAAMQWPELVMHVPTLPSNGLWVVRQHT